MTDRGGRATLLQAAGPLAAAAVVGFPSPAAAQVVACGPDVSVAYADVTFAADGEPLVGEAHVRADAGCHGVDVTLRFLDAAGDPLGPPWAATLVAGAADLVPPTAAGAVRVVDVEAVSVELALPAAGPVVIDVDGDGIMRPPPTPSPEPPGGSGTTATTSTTVDPGAPPGVGVEGGGTERPAPGGTAPGARPGGTALPRTGQDAVPLVTAGAAAVLAGAVVVFAATAWRRRPRRRRGPGRG